jgi:BirA family biotin operon repressor/biotin-[acetyl-CoA-carboxylase] ligase
MATPYLQIFTEDVPSTQDLAGNRLAEVPVAVIAARQSQGRGRYGSVWENADRSLAVSVAWHTESDDHRPFSLMAGVAAVRSLDQGTALKWPNDVTRSEKKIGGILVERSEGKAVAGLGVNLFWSEPSEGAGALFEHDPGDVAYRELGALWVAEFLSLVGSDGWPIEEYRAMCSTLGREITWEPNGAGIAAGINHSGALLVETSRGIEEIHAGAVRHVRPGEDS